MLVQDSGQASEARILDAVKESRDALAEAVVQFRESALHLQIEEALARNGLALVATFQLPQSVGGQLEIVREVVAKAIEMKTSVGVNVEKALRELQAGDAAQLALKFSLAFDHYRKAYQALLK